MSANLQTYLPRLILHWEPGEIHRAIEGSMVFVDISGFTKMSERLARHGNVGAEEVTEVIDNTFVRLLPEAYAFGANLLKFGGDALLLFFTDEGHALRAAAAALAMRATLREIGEFQTTAGKVSLRMSVGVHSGRFDLFLVGGSHRELIVAGPSATRTVEMEGAATAGQILLSPETAAALPRRNRGRESGPGVLLRADMPGVDKIEVGLVAAPELDLTPFIPDALRQTLLSGDVNPEHRPAAVAFLHYGNFDRLIDDGGSEAAGELLDRLVRSVQDAANSRGVAFLGSDIAPDGGKIILTAGVPDTSGNDEEQMLLTVREIVNRAQAELPLHIGVNWGHVFAGEVGPPYRRTYTIMGDTVNLAARLMSKAPPGEIYTTQGVLEGSRTTFQVSTPAPFYVKGKKLPIQAFSVGEPEGSRTQSGDGHLALIGRDQELKGMLRAWETATSGVGQVVEVSAEAGMGKSRLLEEFLVTSGHERLVRAECRLYQAATPYFPFRALLRGAWGMQDPDPAVSEADLRHLVQLHAPELEPWVALIGRPLGLDLAESPEVAELEDQFRPVRTMVAVGALLEATIDSPTLFVIEDTHWMDEASRELLAGLLSGLARLPWLFALTRRPGEDGFLAPDTGSLTRIQLQPLGIDEAKALIENATEDSPLLSQQVETLARRAEGSPLFLIELLQALRRGGDVDALPPSVEGLIGARIDTLPSADRNVLRRVAVLGTGFRSEHAAAVLPQEPQWQGKAMRRLSDFLSADQSGWVQFRHALIRDVAYQGLPFKTRLDLHATVGDSIKTSAGDNPDDQAELLSLHYSEARRWPEAWRFSRVAGDNAKTLYANQEAATFYERALEAARHLPEVLNAARAQVHTTLGDVLELAGRFEESLSAYRRASHLIAGDRVLEGALLLKRARVRVHAGAYRAAIGEITRGYRAVLATEDPVATKTRARLTALHALIRQAQQRASDALRLSMRAVEEAKVAEDDEALARAYLVMDWAYFVLGKPEQATHHELALDTYERLGDMDGAGNVMNNLGGFAYFNGDWDKAVDWYLRAQDAYRRAGNEVSAAVAGGNLGELLVSQGRLAEAEPILHDAAMVLRAARDVDDLVFVEIQLARLKYEKGETGQSILELVTVRDEATNFGKVGQAFEAALYLSFALLAEGRCQEALTVLDEAEAGPAGADPLYGPTVARARTTALIKLGRLDVAQDQVVAGISGAQEQGLAYEEALLRILKADLRRATGGAPDPYDLERANALLTQFGVRPKAHPEPISSLSVT